MRRLTLILSDLYLPADNPSRATRIRLAGLEWLLARAGSRRSAEWRAALCEMVGCADFASAAPATLAAHGRLPGEGATPVWLATPLHLEARLDHVHLPAGGLLSIDAAERQAWCAAFAATFGPELALIDAGPGAFLLTGLSCRNVRTRDPARFLGADISAGLAQGPDAAHLRRLGAEIEMWLHGSALNREREKRRVRPVSALWLWGGGESAGTSTAAAERSPARAATGSLAFAGQDAVLAGIARLVTGEGPATVPTGWRAHETAADHAVVELELAKCDRGPGALDEDWFAPARDALSSGRLHALDILANDRVFHITRADRFAFWRRRAHWLDALGRVPGAKA